MSERSLRQSYHAIIRAVAAADEDALDRLIAEDHGSPQCSAGTGSRTRRNQVLDDHDA